MPDLIVPNTYCRMTYQSVPPGVFVANFTSHKQRVWGLASAAIDEYIHDEIKHHIQLAIGLRPAAAKYFVSQAHHQTMRNRIYAEVNRGLAIIAYEPTVKIYGQSPYGIIDAQTFTNAMRLLISDLQKLRKDECRERATRCRVWADACAYRLMEAVTKSLVRY